MAKRKSFKDNAGDPFDVDSQPQQNVDSSWLEADSQIFGALSQADNKAERTRIREFDIFGIVPDITQPRRSLPTEIRNLWDNDPAELSNLFRMWLMAIKEERGDKEFPLAEYMNTTEIIADQTDPRGYLENSLIEIIDLAVSIRRDGLTNPITIFEVEDYNQLETGERRWLAYHLLHYHFNDERKKWRNIPARKMPRFDVWRQASENNARQNLNAIGRARQFALLMIDLWEQDGKTFEPFNAFEVEQDFYAQVKNMKPPHGKSGVVLSAMGFTHRNAIYRHRQLLTLPYEIWQRADDTNCPESVLRNMVGKSLHDAQEIFHKWQRGENYSTSPIVTSGDNSPPPKISQTAKSNRPTLLPDPACQRGNRLFTKEKEQQISQTVKELVALRSGVGQAKSQTKSQIRQLADDIRRFLDEIERTIK